MIESPYESRIVQFERQYANKVDGKTLLIGSSSFDFWLTSKYDLLPLQTVNLGIGGTMVIDWNYAYDRIITPLNPTNIVSYLGINDILSGISGEETAKSLIDFYKLIHKKLNNTKLFIVSLNPSIAFFDKWDQVQIVNNLIKEFAANNSYANFINSCNIFFDSEGVLVKEYYRDDGLHLSNSGYRIWSKAIKDYLFAKLME